MLSTLFYLWAPLKEFLWSFETLSSNYWRLGSTEITSDCFVWWLLNRFTYKHWTFMYFLSHMLNSYMYAALSFQVLQKHKIRLLKFSCHLATCYFVLTLYKTIISFTQKCFLSHWLELSRRKVTVSLNLCCHQGGGDGVSARQSPFGLPHLWSGWWVWPAGPVHGFW